MKVLHIDWVETQRNCCVSPESPTVQKSDDDRNMALPYLCLKSGTSFISYTALIFQKPHGPLPPLNNHYQSWCLRSLLPREQNFTCKT